ncbi:YbaK/EbsC family protein [Arthrobacter sp. AQ5-05]|uniref:YbaK/EbsC family protein n=1 Tax=Arthrobacter sp. AQ5-05 TaxID=2184581 RepID=UPI002570347B|nr:YbaK/EbsC family protein [Arthrobacter sp. AQ5-05]
MLGSDRLDVNSAVRKALGAKKVSFAPMDIAVELTGMEYGGITPIGLPDSRPLLIDSVVAAAGHLVIGSGIRGSKILTSGAAPASLPGAEVLPPAKEQDQ